MAGRLHRHRSGEGDLALPYAVLMTLLKPFLRIALGRRLPTVDGTIACAAASAPEHSARPLRRRLHRSAERRRRLVRPRFRSGAGPRLPAGAAPAHAARHALGPVRRADAEHRSPVAPHRLRRGRPPSASRAGRGRACPNRGVRARHQRRSRRGIASAVRPSSPCCARDRAIGGPRTWWRWASCSRSCSSATGTSS